MSAKPRYLFSFQFWLREIYEKMVVEIKKSMAVLAHYTKEIYLLLWLLFLVLSLDIPQKIFQIHDRSCLVTDKKLHWTINPLLSNHGI